MANSWAWTFMSLVGRGPTACALVGVARLRAARLPRPHVVGREVASRCGLGLRGKGTGGECRRGASLVVHGSSPGLGDRVTAATFSPIRADSTRDRPW